MEGSPLHAHLISIAVADASYPPAVGFLGATRARAEPGHSYPFDRRHSPLRSRRSVGAPQLRTRLLVRETLEPSPRAQRRRGLHRGPADVGAPRAWRDRRRHVMQRLRFRRRTRWFLVGNCQQ